MVLSAVSPQKGVPLLYACPRPLRVDFHWVPGSDLGTFNSSLWLLDLFLAQLGYYMSFCFEHYQDNLSHICEILGHLTGRALGCGQPPTSTGTYPCPTIMSYFARILRRLFKTRTFSLRTVPQCPALCSRPRASHQWPRSCLW